MKRFANLAAFIAFGRTELPARVAAGKAAGLELAGKMFAAEMKGELGTYQSGDSGFEDWAPLSRATLEGWEGIGGRLEGKIERGFAPPDNPLKATSALDDSIGSTVDGDRVVAGSTDIVAVYQNQGTKSRGVPFVRGLTTEPGIPGREFVGRAGFRKAPDAVEAIALAVIGEMVKP